MLHTRETLASKAMAVSKTRVTTVAAEGQGMAVLHQVGIDAALKCDAEGVCGGILRVRHDGEVLEPQMSDGKAFYPAAVVTLAFTYNSATGDLMSRDVQTATPTDRAMDYVRWTHNQITRVNKGFMDCVGLRGFGVQ